MFLILCCESIFYMKKFKYISNGNNYLKIQLSYTSNLYRARIKQGEFVFQNGR